MTDGPNTLRFTFNLWRPLRTFTYATSNLGFNRRLGKLWVARAYNYPVIGTTAYTAEITETYGYAGKQGRVSVRDTVTQWTAPSTGVLGSFTQDWTWNDLGDPASITYPRCTNAGCAATTMRTMTPGYTNGFLTSVPGYASSITYHPNGQVNQVFRANDTTDICTKDPQNQARPRKIETRVTSSGTLRWQSGLLSYDGAGNLTRAGSAYYLYDPVSRVTEGLIYLAPGGSASGASASFDHAYDGFGNLQSLTTNTTTRNTPTSATTNRLLGAAGYDAAGNLTSWGVTTPGTGATYRYEALNQMWGMTNGAEDWYYLYTADGERILSFKPSADLSRWTVRDLDGKLLREFHGQGGLWRVERDYVYRGSQLLAAHTPDPAPNDLIHLHPDHLGTPRAITNQNSARTDYHVYFPFGEEASSAVQDAERMKFTGHERDLGDPSSPADDLDYMHARFYNPQTGRFLSMDPKRHHAPLSEPQLLNRYSYSLGNPQKYVDPDGKEPVTATIVVGGGVIIATTAIAVHLYKMHSDPEYRAAANSAASAVAASFKTVDKNLQDTQEQIRAGARNLALEGAVTFVILSKTTAPGRGQPPPTAIPGAKPKTTPAPELSKAAPDDPKQPPTGADLVKKGAENKKQSIWDLLGEILGEILPK